MTIHNRQKLEDRLLILQDKIDVLEKTYDPNQPRDSQGQWAETGGGVSSPNVVSNLRRGNWKHEDFHMAGIKNTEDRDVDVYNHVIPKLHPVEFKRGFLGPYSDKSDLAIKALLRKPSLDVDGLIQNKNGDNLGAMNRVYQLWGNKERVANHNSFALKASQQGKGVAKSILASQINMYKKLGIDRIELEANVDVGSYAWAKYGFVPVNWAWDILRNQIAKRYEVGQERGFYSDDSYVPVTRAIGSGDPRAVWAISDLTAPVSNAHGASTEFGRTVYGTQEFLPEPAKFNTLGKYLLGNTSWRGKLNLTNAEQMSRFNAYVKR